MMAIAGPTMRPVPAMQVKGTHNSIPPYKFLLQIGILSMGHGFSRMSTDKDFHVYSLQQKFKGIEICFYLCPILPN